MVKKLSDKGLAVNENAVIRSLVTREEVQRQESHRFVDQVFAGSLHSFLRSYYGGNGIRQKEAEKLLELIRKMKTE